MVLAKSSDPSPGPAESLQVTKSKIQLCISAFLFFFKDFIFIILNMYMCVYIHVMVCTYECRCPRGSEECVGLPGARVSGSFEPPNMGAGTELMSSARTVHALNC